MQIALAQLIHQNTQSIVAMYEDRHNLVTLGPGVQLLQQPVSVRRIKVCLLTTAACLVSLLLMEPSLGSSVTCALNAADTLCLGGPPLLLIR